MNLKINKSIITLLCASAILCACVNDPEKHTESEVDPETKDTAVVYEKAGAKDATDGDTTSKSGQANKNTKKPQ